MQTLTILQELPISPQASAINTTAMRTAHLCSMCAVSTGALCAAGRCDDVNCWGPIKTTWFKYTQYCCPESAQSECASIADPHQNARRRCRC